MTILDNYWQASKKNWTWLLWHSRLCMEAQFNWARRHFHLLLLFLALLLVSIPCRFYLSWHFFSSVECSCCNSAHTINIQMSPSKQFVVVFVRCIISSYTVHGLNALAVNEYCLNVHVKASHNENAHPKMHNRK